MQITLKIDSEDGAYKVEVTKAMQAIYMHRITPGSLVKVWINPSQPDHVVFNFDDDAASDEDEED